VPRWIPLAVLLLIVACGRRDVRIEVAIPGPDSVDAPVAHIGIVALPYDRDSLLATMAAKHPRPEGLVHQLDSLFGAFRGPFTGYAAAAYRVQGLERDLGHLRLRIDSLPRSSPTYDSLYRVFAALSDSVTAARHRRDAEQNTLAEARNRYSAHIDSLRRRMASWEDSTYRGYDSITKTLTSGLGREAIADSTGPDGSVTITLPPGNWWIYARSWDAWDPNSEWYWNVPVKGDHVVLDRSTGRRMPRYGA
jgi:hypothetical protein